MRISDWSSDVFSSDLLPSQSAGTGCRIVDPKEFGALPERRGVAAIVQYGTEAGLQRGPALAALADVEIGQQHENGAAPVDAATGDRIETLDGQCVDAARHLAGEFVPHLRHRIPAGPRPDHRDRQSVV